MKLGALIVLITNCTQVSISQIAHVAIFPFNVYLVAAHPNALNMLVAGHNL